MTSFPSGRIALYTLLALSIPTTVEATSVYCHRTGESWEDTRTVEQLLEVGANNLCDGGAIREGSKITDEQRQVLNTIIVVTVATIAASRMQKQ